MYLISTALLCIALTLAIEFILIIIIVIPPEIREGMGEVEIASKYKIPKLIEPSGILPHSC